MRWTSAALALAMTTSALADDHPTFQSLWDSVSKTSGCTSQDDVDLTIVTCDQDKTTWYFTKVGHPAHPGVIKRYVFERDKAVYGGENAWSFASDAGQPAMKTLLMQIRALDAQVKDMLTPNAESAGPVKILIQGNWQPTGTENQALVSLTTFYFSLEDGDHPDEAYALLEPTLTSQWSYAQYTDQVTNLNTSVGKRNARLIRAIDWEKDPPAGPSGTFAAVDYTAMAEHGEICGYVVWRQLPDHFFVLVREETNIIPSKVPANVAAQMKAKFHCVQ